MDVLLLQDSFLGQMFFKSCYNCIVYINCLVESNGENTLKYTQSCSGWIWEKDSCKSSHLQTWTYKIIDVVGEKNACKKHLVVCSLTIEYNEW